MIKYINLYLLLISILASGCSDDPVNSNGNVETGDIFFTIAAPNNFAFKSYSIKADGTNKKLIRDSMLVTSIPYSGKLTLARADSGFYYNKMYVANLDGKNLVEIPRNNYYPVYFILSPYADKVLFTTGEGNYMFVVNADGTNLIQISNSIGAETIPKFSPDGNYIAYLESPIGSSTGLYLIKTNGTDKTLLKDSIVHNFGESLDWSPDGNKIAFVNSDPFPPDICIINSDGSGYLKIAEGTNPAWSPDGSKISFLSNVNGGIYDLYMINPDGSSEINLSNTPNVYDAPPCWSPDSKKILYHTYTIPNTGNLKIFDINAMTSTVLTDSSSTMGFWKR